MSWFLPSRAVSSEMRACTWGVMRAGSWGVTCLLLLGAGQGGAGQMPSMVMVKEEGGRLRREVGPVVQGKEQEQEQEQEPGQEKKKYRRLEHSIMVQADIRSRLDQEQEQEQEKNRTRTRLEGVDK